MNFKGGVAVIGGGPAGIMAAIQAAEQGAEVTLYEGTPRLLNKLRISGKGRCNLTNACDREEFLSNVLRGQRFFRSAFTRFDNEALMNFVEGLGVPLKIERGGRVFPVSDRAGDVAQALVDALGHAGVKAVLRSKAKKLYWNGESFTLELDSGHVVHPVRVVLACGGESYPGTGSDGSGYTLARALGHGITQRYPSLAPVDTVETWPREAAGLSLRNVGLSAYAGGKRVFYEQGEMLFTHTGVSGPLVLSASCHLKSEMDCHLMIDLKPALTPEQLDARILRDFEKYSSRAAKNALGDLLPRSLIEPVVTLWGIGDQVVNQVTKPQRRELCRLLKELPLTVKSIGPREAAIVTRGGVELRQVNPKTMESKLVPGLYFAGEILDLDGYTGGFNLQIAFSTGFAAGTACGLSLQSKEV